MSWKSTPVALLCLFAFSAHAQDEKAGGDVDNARYELGIHLGNLLPNKIDGITEITGLGGVRVGARIAPLTFAEAGAIMGNGNGAQWKNAHLDIRMDIPVENLVGLAYVGADTVYYKGVDGNSHIIFGGHAGGGLQVPLGPTVAIRSDMKFSFSPGTSLYVGIGIVFRFGGT